MSLTGLQEMSDKRRAVPVKRTKNILEAETGTYWGPTCKYGHGRNGVTLRYRRSGYCRECNGGAEAAPEPTGTARQRLRARQGGTA